MIDYHVRIAPRLLPHLAGRALTLKRYPNGVDEPFFFEKRCPPHAPAWIERASGSIPYCVLDGLASLVWVANLASLELHPSLHLAAAPDVPTLVAFDLDPGAPADVVDCARLATDLRDMLDVLGLQCFPKTSGSKGMQVYLPLNTLVTYEDTRAFSRGLAQLLERRDPERVVSDMSKAKRAGKVFVDWSQNDRHKTTVNVYSLRAMERPTVSTPLTWDEVAAVRRPEDVQFRAEQTLERVDDHGDLFAPLLSTAAPLP